MRVPVLVVLLAFAGCAFEPAGGEGPIDAAATDTDACGAACSQPDAPAAAELCNDADDDGDGQVDEGFDLLGDPANCGACGHTCMNQLGGVGCDNGTCAPTCSAGAGECDGDVDNGCEAQDTNPVCPAAAAAAATVDGDAADSATLTGTTERFMKVRIRESSGGPDIDITASISLTSDDGPDYDLFVYCPTCGATPLTDTDETVEVGRADGGGDRSFDVFIEVRYDPTPPSSTCAPWTVTITGNVVTTNRCGTP